MRIGPQIPVQRNRKTLNKRNWLLIVLRLFLVVDLSVCLYLVVTQAVAAWYFEKESPEAVRQAIRWDPSNPAYYADLARSMEFSLKPEDAREAIGLYQQATELSPHNADYWAALAHLYEWDGQLENAAHAYEQAGLLFPNSPVINWKIGNFFLRQGRIEPAFQAFQKAMLADPDLARPSFELAWQASGDAQFIATSLLPSREDIVLQYLNYLVATGRMDEAATVWDRLLEMGLASGPKSAFPYLDALLQQGRIDQLQAAWTKLQGKNSAQTAGRTSDGNLITNGDFESEILDGGLDWRVIPTEGVVVSVDDLIFFDGAHSLRIQFDGKHNLDYENIFQYVPAKPSTTYRFMAYLRTRDVTTDNGLRFRCFDAHDPGTPLFETDNLIGTSSWGSQQREFKTGPATRLLVIRLGRLPSHKFDNQIAGTAWVDHISLHEVE
jgi:Tfp pilus assembly protein PilF